MKTILRMTFGTTVAAIALSGCDAAPPAVPSASDSMQAAESGPSYAAIVELIRDPDPFARARKLGALLPKLGPEALPAVKAVLEDAWVFELGAVEFGLLMRYWALHEPAEAAYHTFAESGRGYKVTAIYAALTPWARANPQEALEIVRVWTLPGDPGAAAQIALVRGWCESGKPGLEEYIRDLGAGFERERALLAYAIARSRKDGVDAVVRWAESLPEDDATYRLEAFRNVGTALPQFDLEVARRFCEAHCEEPQSAAVPTYPVVPSAFDLIRAAESGSAPSYEVIVELIGDPDDFAKARKLGALLPTLGPEALPAVKSVLEDAAGVFALGPVEFELLIRYWALHEPAEAAYYAFATVGSGYKVLAIYATTTPWARANPQEALEAVAPWARQSGDPGAAAQIALVRGWCESGKPGLEEYVRDVGAGFERQRALLAYAIARSRKDGVDAVVRWAESLPDDDATYRLEAFRNVGTALPQFDLEVAQRFCDAHCEKPHGSNLRANIAGRWALDDPAAAMEWLEAAPEQTSEVGSAVYMTYSVWGDSDPEAALRWLREKSAGGTPRWLVKTLPVYADLLGKDSPREGLAVAAQLEDVKDRDWVSTVIARRWRLKDEAAAEAWLRESSLPEELLARARLPEKKVEQNQREELERRQKTQPTR